MRRDGLPGILVLLAFAVAMTPSAFAQTPPPGPGPMPRGQRLGPAAGPAGLPPGLMQRLQLTDQQRADIRALVAQHQAARQGANTSLVGLRQQLAAQVFAEKPDTGQIDQLKGQIAAAEADALAARIDLQLRITRVLTPEQRAEALKMTSARPARRMPRGPNRL